MFPRANLLFVQSPSACFNKSSTVRFLLTIKIRSCFIRSLWFARVNNSAALTDAKLSLDVFERLSSDLVVMSVIGSVITFFSESSLSLRSPSAGDLSDPKNLLHWSRQRYIDFFAANRKFDRSQKFHSTTSIIIIPRKSMYTLKYLYSFQYTWLSTEEFIIMPCSSNSNCDVVRGPH